MEELFSDSLCGKEMYSSFFDTVEECKATANGTATLVHLPAHRIGTGQCESIRLKLAKDVCVL